MRTMLDIARARYTTKHYDAGISAARAASLLIT